MSVLRRHRFPVFSRDTIQRTSTRSAAFVALLILGACGSILASSRPRSTLNNIVNGPTKNAFCLIGHAGSASLDTFLQKVVNVLGGDVFIIKSDRSNSEVIFQPNQLLVQYYVGGDANGLEEFYNLHAPAWRAASAGNFLGGLPSHPSGHGAYQLRDRWLCEQLVSASEKIRGFHYDHVGIGRRDLLWISAHPTVKVNGCWIPCKGNDWGGVCDQWAWCDRSAAFVYLTSPLTNIPTSAKFRDLNTEKHLLRVLKKEKVEISRGEDVFLRSCRDALPNCKKIVLHGERVLVKTSGGQIERTLHSEHSSPHY